VDSKDGIDAFFGKIDALGGQAWIKPFGDVYTQIAQAVILDNSGDVLVAGLFGGTIELGEAPLEASGYTDLFIAKIHP
jgi:hypothetical protein